MASSSRVSGLAIAALLGSGAAALVLACVPATWPNPLPDGPLDVPALRRWLKKAAVIQWDYANIVKRRGVLIRLDLPAGPENSFLKIPESRKPGAKKTAEKPEKKAAPKTKPVAKKKPAR